MKKLFVFLGGLFLVSFLAKRKFIFPLKHFTTNTLYSKFGYRTEGFHNGCDFAVPTGSTVIASDSGKVINVSSGGLGGIQIIIQHDNEYMTAYLHLSATLVKVNDFVKQGQIIAKSGNTGYSTGAHLHFSIYDLKKNEYIDPMKFLT